jgi:predicted murein hydrolase (TIGR00659 family)
MFNSLYFGLALSLFMYFTVDFLKKWIKTSLFNPLLISSLLIILILSLLKIEYSEYNQSAQWLHFMLTPATIVLAVPLYQQFKLLEKHALVIFLGVLSGVIASLISVYLLSILFGLDQTMMITLLPKSITAAIAIGVAEEYQGIVTITVAAVIITGITGNVIAEPVCKFFRIKNPIAKGIAIGTSSHVVGTSKAMEMGEVEGAMSSLAIVVAGLTTVILLSFILI